MINIFVSRPNAIITEQDETVNAIAGLLKSRGMVMRTIGATDFPNVAPLLAVEQVMKECDGAIILGFPQLHVLTGIIKPGTSKQLNIKNKKIPTPWNHIEATMAFLLDLPMIIIRDENIDGGIFDVGTTGHFIHSFDLCKQEWIHQDRFLQPFNSWHAEVMDHNKRGNVRVGLK